ncbi:MAG: iron-sulfur cluster assembly accessory protein [Rickettsia sp.]|nr:iron-sulfur cluster assembly accessory protein [Rickettsia sp.]
MNNFNITNSAAKRISFLQNNSSEKKYFRISVNGGGCSGFMYEFVFTREKHENDLVFQKNSVFVLIDEISQKFLNNAKLEFIEELGNSYFQISNPNASSKCGCGNSFSL